MMGGHLGKAKGESIGGNMPYGTEIILTIGFHPLKIFQQSMACFSVDF